uniref:Uncharacterized protein n=1 Tax=Panagrolaimus sp. PS1159 TaxID=55785 RepID=A0AC35FHK7_9BILA
MKAEMEKYKAKSARDDSTIKSLRNLLLNVRDMYQETCEKIEKQNQMILQLETAHGTLFEENVELKKDIKRMQNEITTQKFDQPVNHISLFQELQEFNDEIDQTSQSCIEKPEVPRGSKFMQNLAEHQSYETESKAEKPSITPLAAAAVS